MVAPVVVSIPVHAVMMVFDEVRFQLAYLMSGGKVARRDTEVWPQRL